MNESPDITAAVKLSRKVVEMSPGDLMRRTGCSYTEALQRQKLAKAYLARFDKDLTNHFS